MRGPDPIPPLKNHLARILVGHLRGWSQVNAACLIGTDQPRISDLRHGRLDRFSLEQLVRFLARLGGEATIDITWRPRRYGPRNERGRPMRAALSHVAADARAAEAHATDVRAADVLPRGDDDET